jgi:hypothetical protein
MAWRGSTLSTTVTVGDTSHMPDDYRLRVGGWVPRRGDRVGTATSLSASVGAPVTEPVVSADHGPPGHGRLWPDRWDVLPEPGAAAGDGPGPGGYVGRRRAMAPGRRHRARPEAAAAPRRIALVVAAVAAVLLGTGALAKTLPIRPIGSPAPVPAPNPPQVAAPPTNAPVDTSEVGTAPSPAPSPTQGTVVVPPPPAPPATAVPPTVVPSIDPPATVVPVPDPVTFVYEAEAAELSGFVRLFDVEDASGGGVVGMIGMHVSNHVRFPEVTVDTAGVYELTLYYVSAPDRQAMVSINDGELVTVEFPALGDWRGVGSVSMPVELAAGPNAIWFGNADGPAPALDRITVAG